MRKKFFLQDTRVLKRSWLSLWLNKMGAEVTGFSLKPPTNPSLFDLAEIAKDMHSIEGDIRNFSLLQEEIKKADPEIIFHMAAQPLVRASYNNPLETYSTNVMGTVHVHEAAKSCPRLKAFINVTTDKCYENKERLEGYKETEALGGYDPYSNSKACSELISSAYRQSFELPVASARAGNVIGGGDWALDRLLPDIYQAYLDKREVNIRNPKSIRPWQHVLEPLSGYLVLAQKLYADKSLAGAYNFGPDQNDIQTVEWIVTQITQQWGEGAHFKITSEKGPHEARYLSLNCDKAKQNLNWSPKWKLSQVLPKISAWYKSIATAPHRAKELCLAEINEYEKS
ncbi:MAG: CDP-glucose 4,6-dehydratase [Bdellovibrionota bacterium]